MNKRDIAEYVGDLYITKNSEDIGRDPWKVRKKVAEYFPGSSSLSEEDQQANARWMSGGVEVPSDKALLALYM